MNCVNCGHSMKAHDGDKCTGSPDCVCKEWQRVKFSVDETSTFRAELVASKLATLRAELAAYKAEAMAAREYIAMLELNARFVYETAPVRLAYMAARVKD